MYREFIHGLSQKKKGKKGKKKVFRNFNSYYIRWVKIGDL